MIIFINGKEIYCEGINGASEVIVPFYTDESGSAQISFYLPDAVSPKELKDADDTRMLSLDMTSILIEEKHFR